MDKKKQLLAFALCSLVGVVQAGEKEELLKLRNTTTNLIKELVKQGVLTEKVAEEMIRKAEVDAEQQAESQAKSGVKSAPLEPGEVRVPYVPEFVKDDIRRQVRSELRADVVSDVMKEAKTQQWGVPNALPEWISRFKISGDLRLRSQGDYMGADNTSDPYYYNYQAINNGVSYTNNIRNDALYNTTEDRQRFRERLRLSIDAKINEGLKAGLRLATGNMPDPVSTNQTLGNTGSQYQFNLDRAFLKYDAVNDDGFKWLSVAGGRIANPWYVGGGEFNGGSELVWDTDLSFEGIAATGRYSLADAEGINEKGDNDHSVYLTVGAFPLQDSVNTLGNRFSSSSSSHNKWMFGGQLGLDWGFNNQDVFRMAAAYYDYQNIKASVNRTQNIGASGNNSNCDLNTADNNQSVPQYLQGGNSMVGICQTNSVTTLAGLASDFKIININGAYDLAAFAPYHVVLGADYAKNVGTIPTDFVILPGSANGTNAWQLRMDAGWPKVDRYGNWNVFAQYKYIQANAVLDAFTDSDFHLGGTNAKGWVVGGNYGLMKNTWLTGRWLSSDVITGPKYGIDTLQVDINTRF
jgi:polyhydroxyalkanoate synthesis regulator phasin